MRHWTTTEAKRARECRAEGMTYRSIGDQIGRSEFAVYGFLNPSYTPKTYRYDLTAPCPACGAKPGSPCRAQDRRKRKWAHLERSGR